MKKLILLEVEQAFDADLLAGFAAEAASCVFWVPIDVVKERLQVQSNFPAFQNKVNPKLLF